ncbi:hypothetical protein OH492_18105 [Vibrio chagasii]|nr:hypothetical protein [Vibrio chagasii]
MAVIAQSIEMSSKQFFELIANRYPVQVSLGQTNTVALCPALTTHSRIERRGT